MSHTELGDTKSAGLLQYVPIQYDQSALFELRDQKRKLYDPYDEKYNGLRSGLVMTCHFDMIPNFRQLVDRVIVDTFGLESTDDYSMMGDFFRISRYQSGEHVRIHVDDYDEFTLGFLMIVQEPTDGGNFILNGVDMNLRVGDLLLFSNGIPHEVLPIVSGIRIAAFGRFTINQ